MYNGNSGSPNSNPNSPGSLPQYNEKTLYEVKLGKSFTQNKSKSKISFHTLQYSFKPNSVSGQSGSVTRNESGRLQVDLNTNGDGQVIFHGNFSKGKEGDCILIFDGETFTLESISTAGKLLTRTFKDNNSQSSSTISAALASVIEPKESLNNRGNKRKQQAPTTPPRTTPVHNHQTKTSKSFNSQPTQKKQKKNNETKKSNTPPSTNISSSTTTTSTNVNDSESSSEEIEEDIEKQLGETLEKSGSDDEGDQEIFDRPTIPTTGPSPSFPVSMNGQTAIDPTEGESSDDDDFVNDLAGEFTEQLETSDNNNNNNNNNYQNHQNHASSLNGQTLNNLGTSTSDSDDNSDSSESDSSSSSDNDSSSSDSDS